MNFLLNATLTIFTLAILVLVFHLGGTWSVHKIRSSLNEKGVATAQYGDSLYVKIKGTTEDVGD